jgi:hypothetical protein
MGKTRNKNRSEVEFLRGELKKLRAENIRLRRDNKHHERRTHFYEEVIDHVADEIKATICCEACGKGTLIEMDFKYVKYLICDLCETKKRL